MSTSEEFLNVSAGPLRDVPAPVPAPAVNGQVNPLAMSVAQAAKVLSAWGRDGDRCVHEKYRRDQ